MQQIARIHSQRIIDENQQLRSELESKMQNLELTSKKLDELAARSDSDRRKLEHEKEKVCNVPVIDFITYRIMELCFLFPLFISHLGRMVACFCTPFFT